ncbi:MAG TPA: hypothetical protein DD379_09170 [Cyanobacteria bacterium UBA11162]|nr:hypothetical protein [Cyanobacteria bacterium UBA11162]
MQQTEIQCKQIQAGLERLADIKQYLENCYGLDNPYPQTVKFFEEMAQLEGMTAVEVYEKSITGLQTLWAAFREWQQSVDQLGILSEIKWAEEFDRLQIKFYETLFEIVREFWGYLPVETQQTLEHMGMEVLVSIQNNELITFEKEVLQFMGFLSKLKETHKVKPKLRLSDFEPPYLVIQNLLKELSKLPQVEKVQTVVCEPLEFNEINIYIVAPHASDKYGEFDNVGELWETAKKIVFVANQQLRQLTNKKWYLFVKVVKDIKDIS